MNRANIIYINNSPAIFNGKWCQDFGALTLTIDYGLLIDRSFYEQGLLQAPNATLGVYFTQASPCFHTDSGYYAEDFPTLLEDAKQTLVQITFSNCNLVSLELGTTCNNLLEITKAVYRTDLVKQKQYRYVLAEPPVFEAKPKTLSLTT